MLPPVTKKKDIEASEAITELVDEIASIVFFEDGGTKTDWDCYPFEMYQLVCAWRKAERFVENLRQMKLQMFIKNVPGDGKETA